jgi:hypothetical protein
MNTNGVVMTRPCSWMTDHVRNESTEAAKRLPAAGFHCSSIPASFASRRLVKTARNRSRFMPREPSYPEDAPVGPPPPHGAAKASGAPAPDPKKEESHRTRHLVTGAAIGIGSAAIVAALLWANRAKKGDE